MQVIVLFSVSATGSGWYPVINKCRIRVTGSRIHENGGVCG